MTLELTRAPLLAFLAGVVAVLATWDVLVLVERARPVVRGLELLAPLRAVGARGRLPDADERRRLGLLTALVGLGGGWTLTGPVGGLIVAGVAPWALGRLVGLRRERWRRALAAGAAPVARTLADALAGGHAVRGALQDAGRPGAFAPEVDAELRSLGAALALGERTEVALEQLRDRARDPGWDTIVAAIGLQREAGGDLAGLLRDIATELDASRRAEADARAATAQARATAWIVCGLPVAGAVLVELGSPGTTAQTLGSPVGAALSAGAVVLQGFALLAVGRLSRLERQR